MTSMSDSIVDGDNCAYDSLNVDLKGGGIDLNDLRAGKETVFEIDPESVANDMGERSMKDKYFNEEELFKQLNNECLDPGSDSEDENNDMLPFERMSLRMEKVTADGGVLKKILHEGVGNVVPQYSLCTVHYNGWFELADEPFDSSRMRGRKHQFKLGAGREIPGFELGAATMKRGELARFIMDHTYAYGKLGCPPRIPAQAQVMFEIEMISFIEQSDLDNVNDMDETQRSEASFDKILAACKNLRLEGNEAFKTGAIGRASARYSRALRMLENANLADEEDEEKMKADAHILYMNLSMCDLKTKGKAGRAAKYARKALEREPGNVRAIYRLAKAHHQLGEYSQAKTHFTKALKLDPNNREITEAVQELNKDMKKEKTMEAAVLKKMMQISTDDKPAKKDTAAKSKVADEERQPSVSTSQMVELIKARLQAFKDTPGPSMILPNSLTDGEVDLLKDVASQLEMEIVVKSNPKNGERIINVTKQES